MDKPVFDLKIFFPCFTKTNKLKWESDITLVEPVSECAEQKKKRTDGTSGAAMSHNIAKAFWGSF